MKKKSKYDGKTILILGNAKVLRITDATKFPPKEILMATGLELLEMRDELRRLRSENRKLRKVNVERDQLVVELRNVRMSDAEADLDW